MLIPEESSHPGAGSLVVDGAFEESFLCWLTQELFPHLPSQSGGKPCCSDRSGFVDSRGWVAPALSAAMAAAGTGRSRVLPALRYLHYAHAGGVLPPHTDLSKTLDGQMSSHTFVLFLCDVAEGGETRLLESQVKGAGVLAAVTPRRGRLLIFPHGCPHDGAPVVCPPKLLLRGECL